MTQKQKSSFGEYLKKVRLKHSEHSQTSLAKTLGITQRYVSQIELNIAPPPSFEVCCNICKALELSDDEKNQLLKIALFDRFRSIKSNSPFLAYFQAINLPLDAVVVSESIESHNFILKDDSFHRCVYSMTWFTYRQKSILTSEMRHELKSIIKKIIQNQGFSVEKFHAGANRLEMTLVLDPTVTLHSFIQNLQDYTSVELKENFKELIEPRRSIWEKVYLVSTIGSDQDIVKAESQFSETTARILSKI